MPKSTKVAQIHLPERNSAKIHQISAKIPPKSAKIGQISTKIRQISQIFVSQKSSKFEHPEYAFDLIKVQGRPKHNHNHNSPPPQKRKIASDATPKRHLMAHQMKNLCGFFVFHCVEGAFGASSGGTPQMKNGAPRDEPKNGRGRGWVVPYYFGDYSYSSHGHWKSNSITVAHVPCLFLQ